MRIENDIVSLSGVTSASSVQAGQRQEQAPTKAASTVSGTDRVELSLGAMRVEELKKFATVEALAQSDKVDATKRQIADGTYQVDSRFVAGKMLGLFR